MMLKKSLALLPFIATAGCLAIPPQGTDDADLAAFDEAVTSVGCSLERESDYLPVELQTGLDRPTIQKIAQYRINAGDGISTETGGFRLTSGACDPAATTPAAAPETDIVAETDTADSAG
ncbi:NADH dehydrogenase subunit E [Salipiger profundus]|uniref:NADH dehydrogenase subunit E n=2 Tax=Roseobacteraceae TaxID=2854170 RepID=A0A1U7DBP2_9RHOB|nr:NADH dehydrogenase subunit E [Salipiger profundus]